MGRNKNSGVAASLAAAIVFGLAQPAQGLIYLPENTLEALLVRSDAVVIGTVTEVSEAANRGVIKVDESCKGTASGSIAVTGILLRVTTTSSKPRFAAGDRVVVFLGAEVKGDRPILHAQKLDGTAEIKAMSGCIAEVTPFAPALADLADVKKEVDEKAVIAAAGKLVQSKNAYSQILLGRLMATRLAERVKPAGSEELLISALTSKRKELVHGAIVWAAKLEKRSDKVTAALRSVAANGEEPTLAREAKALLDQPAVQ